MSLLFIKEPYFFPGKASLLFLIIPILDFLPLLIIILIRFFTPRPPNTFISLLCYLIQIFLFLWLEGCGSYTFFKLSSSLALLLKAIFENITVYGLFQVIFSLNSLELIYYSVLTAFHYQINLSFMYAQNTAAIKETKLFFAPSFVPLQRFRLLYLISLSVQQFFENVAYSIYLMYCTLVFINAYLIAARGSLSHVHNGPWVTVFLSTFLLFYSCYNILITVISMALGISAKYGILLLVCLPFSLTFSISITMLLLLLGKRTRINIINEYNQIKVHHLYCFNKRRKYLTIRVLSTTQAKNLKVKALATDEHLYTTMRHSTANCCMQTTGRISNKGSYSVPKDTALLLDPATVQKYTLYTPLSRYMVMILAFYFDVHNVVSFALPNDYTFTLDDINKLVYFIKNNSSDLLAPVQRQYNSMSDLLSSSSPFVKSNKEVLFNNRPRSLSTIHRSTTLMKSSFLVPDSKKFISKNSTLKVKKSIDCMKNLPASYTSISANNDQFNQPVQPSCPIRMPRVPKHLSFCCYKSSDDTLIYRSTASATSTTSAAVPNAFLLTPNQRIFKNFLNALDSQKIFEYVAQAETLLENFKLFYENIYASLFLSYCAASQTLESVTLLDIEECLPIPLLLRYLRAWKTPYDAYNSIIYYIDQLKSIDDLRREYQAAHKDPMHTNTVGEPTPKTIFVELKMLPSFTCKSSCTNCPRCRIHVVCSHCHATIAILLKSTYNVVIGKSQTSTYPFKGFNCPDCNQLCLLKIVDSIKNKKIKVKSDALMHNMAIKPRIILSYSKFLSRLTPLGKRIKLPTTYFKKRVPVVDFLEYKIIPDQTPVQTSTSFSRTILCAKHSKRRAVHLLLKSYINNLENYYSEKHPIACQWATHTYVSNKSTNLDHQFNTDAKNKPKSQTDSKRFSRDRNIGLLHKSYSVISPQNFNGSIYFLSPELFADVASSEDAKFFLYNCRKQNCLFTVFLPTLTSTSSTTGNIHRLSFSYDREASLTSPLRILRMKVLIHLARMLFPANIYVDNICPIQLVPCYKFYALGSSYIENATNRVCMVYSPEFILERQEDSEIRVVGKRANVRRTTRIIYKQEPLYLYCLAQNALTVKTQDKMDSSILQFVNVEYLFMQVAFTGIGNPHLSFFYYLYYTNNVSFLTHLLSLCKKPNTNGNSLSPDVTAKFDKHGSSLSTVSGSIAINAIVISLNCHTLSDQTADAYAVIDRLLGKIYSVHLPVYTWLEMIKIRLSTCMAYLELLYTINSDVFSKFEAAPTPYNTHSFTLEMSTVPSIPSILDLDVDDKKKKDELESNSEKLEGADKKLLQYGQSFNVYTVEDYYEIHTIISTLLSTCQSLLDKQMNEVGFLNESHELYTMKLTNDCSRFFAEYYTVSTQYLLHVTFNLPDLVDYAPSNDYSSHNKPIYRYRNGIPQLITDHKENLIDLNKYYNIDTKWDENKEIGCQSDSSDLEALLSDPGHNFYDRISYNQDSFAASLTRSPLSAVGNFNKLFLPRLPHMVTSCYPKTMVISKKQIAANLFAIYEHVILENDVLETILLNNITINGLPSIDINDKPFSLLSILGKSSSYYIEHSLSRDASYDTQHSSIGNTCIDATQLQNLLSLHAQDLARERYINELVQNFNSRILYEKIGHQNYTRVSAARLYQIIMSLNIINRNAYPSSISLGNDISSADQLLHPVNQFLETDPYYGTNLTVPGVSATFSATFSTTISATHPNIAETQNTFTRSNLSAISRENLISSQITAMHGYNEPKSKNQSYYRPSKSPRLKSPWKSSRILRRLIKTGHKKSLPLLKPDDINVFVRSGSTYTPLNVPFSNSHALPSPTIDSTSMQQLLLSLIVTLNLIHLYTSSNVLTTYEYRGRQFLTLQQNRFILDSTGEYYPASYRHELEQSYTLNFNTQNPDDAVKKFIYCLDESYMGLCQIKSPTIYTRRYLNTDFDLTIPIDGMKYIHASDSPGNLLPTSRAKWLENLKQPDFNTPINVYECIEAQISIKLGRSLDKYRIGFKNLLLYNSIVFDTLIQLRNIIRVDSTLRAKIHAYKMLPRLAMFTNYADFLLKRFFEDIIRLQKCVIEPNSSLIHTMHSEITTRTVVNDVGHNTLMPMMIQHCTELHDCLLILQQYEQTLQNLWTMRLTLLRHSYAEEDFLLLLQNECLRALATSYGIPSKYFFALFSNIINTDPETRQCYMSSSIERVFPQQSDLLHRLSLNTDKTDGKNITSTASFSSPSAKDMYFRQQSTIRYFSLMEYDSKRIETANRQFLITIAELFALGKDPIGQIESILATSPRTAGIYILGPKFNVSQLLNQNNEIESDVLCTSALSVQNAFLDNNRELSTSKTTISTDSASKEKDTLSVSPEPYLSTTQEISSLSSLIIQNCDRSSTLTTNTNITDTTIRSYGQKIIPTESIRSVPDKLKLCSHKTDTSSEIFSTLPLKHRKNLAWFRENCPLFLITILYIVLVYYILSIYSCVLTSYIIAKNFIMQSGYISGMMAAFSDLRTELTMNIALQQTKNNPFEILSNYIERFTEIMNSGYSAHTITSAMYNGLSINDVITREPSLYNAWPPPMLYYSAEQMVNPQDLLTINDYQSITCRVTMSALSNKSTEALMNSKGKLPKYLNYLTLKMLPLTNLKHAFSGFNFRAQKRDFTQLQQSDIRIYLNIYNKFNIGLYDSNFRKFVDKHPVTIPIVPSYPINSKVKALENQVNPHTINYFEITELLINRIVCMAASMLYISQQDSTFDPLNILLDEAPKLSLYRPLDSILLEADLLQTIYQSMYINLQKIVINAWEIYSQYSISRLFLVSFILIAIGLYIPLYYLNFKKIQKRLLRAKLDRACTLANILSLPPTVLENIIHNYEQASLIPFKQFLCGNHNSSETDIVLPREYYSDIYSYTQSKSVYNQSHFKLAELTTYSTKTIKNNLQINKHNDPDHSSRFDSYTSEISLILRLVTIYNKISTNKLYIALYVCVCMVLFFFVAINITLPLHFKSPFTMSGLDPSNYYDRCGDPSHFSFQLSVNGWDPETIDQVQLAQQQLYEIDKITQDWVAPSSKPSSFAINGHDLISYMTGARAIEFATNKLYFPFHIKNFMDGLVQTPFVYAFEYIRDHTKIMVSLLQWIDEVNFIESASTGPRRCIQCKKMYYLLQYVLKTSPISLLYHIELLSHLSDISTENFIESNYYLDFFMIHKRFLDVFSKIHDTLWHGTASHTDVSAIVVFLQRYNYFSNYNTTGPNNYNENTAIALIQSIPHNTALPSMVKKHESLVRSLLDRLYGGPIIFNAILLMLFIASIFIYLIISCIFVHNSVVRTIKSYDKNSSTTQCACSIKYLLSCFMPIDLMIAVPVLLTMILFMSIPIMYNTASTIIAILLNYTTYNLSIEAILREDITFVHKIIPLSYRKFYLIQSVTNYFILLIVVFSSLSHHITLRSRTVIDTVGYAEYTKEQEQNIPDLTKRPFVVSVNEKINTYMPTNRSICEQYSDDDGTDKETDTNNKPNQYFDVYDDYVPTTDDLPSSNKKNIDKPSTNNPNYDPFLRENDFINVTYNLPIFLPPLSIPKQKIEYIEQLLRYSLIWLFIVAMYLLISSSRLASYTPKHITTAFLDQLIHNYNILRAQLSQIYAYPAISYKEPHLFINTFKNFRQIITFLLSNKYTQGVLAIPVKNMHVFKNMGIDNDFREYGQHIDDFLQMKIYGYNSKVIELSNSTIEYDTIIPTSWMSGNSYYNAWSSLPPSNRSRLFISTKIPDCHKDKFMDNRAFLPLYQKILLLEYPYYQSNFANIEENINSALVRSATGTYGATFANLSPEFKKIIHFDIIRNHVWVESLYCNHYLRIASTLLHSISVSQALIELLVILILTIIIAAIHIIAHRLLLLIYNKKLTLYEVFTVLFLKRIRGLVN